MKDIYIKIFLVARFIIIYIDIQLRILYIYIFIIIHLNLVKCSIFWCQAPKGAFIHVQSIIKYMESLENKF